ncbi:MAG: hypothetical protein K2Y39_28125 [Candidatus Obscuribacterales bacterium]|nr:hypothetical protein [Candidatus Obscuribacterales bacterium]
MTKQLPNFERNESCIADSNCNRAYVSPYEERDAGRMPQQEQIANAARSQSELVVQRVIPNVEIENKSAPGRSDWASARVEARQESMRNILGGNPIHQIRYGDTLWDVASASFQKNNGQKPSNSEVMAECNRLAKKNNIADMNNIPIGTKLDTSPETAPDRGIQNTGVYGRDRQRDSTPTWEQLQKHNPNYYDLNGGARRYENRNQSNTPNYYEFSGGLPQPRDSRTRSPFTDYREFNRQNTQEGPVILPDLRDQRRLPNGDIPLTPQTTRDLLRGGRNEGTFGPRSINPGIETAAQAKNTATWRNAHNELVAKARRGAPNVAFYGDSITQGLQLNPGFKTSFGRSENFGIGGDTNQNLLYRLRNGEANFAGSQPETAVLLIGTNNIGSQTPDKIAAGILANARELASRMPGTEVVVMGILPRGFSANDPLRQQVNSVNDMVRRQLDGIAGVKFVDIGPQMLEPNGNMRAGIFQRDNVHLTYNAGYSAMLRALQPHVKTRR